MTDLIDRLRSVDRVFATEAADRIEQLERENAELRKDAERYRFVRDADRSECISYEISLYAMETLDEYVDAAIEGEEAMKEQT